MKKEHWVLALTSIASLMVAVDQLVVATALSTIKQDLDASLEALEWTVNAYSRYAAAFEDADIVALEQLLTKDVVWEMPPAGRSAGERPAWFRVLPSRRGRALPRAFAAGPHGHQGRCLESGRVPRHRPVRRLRAVRRTPMMPALPSGPEATALLERSINYARGAVRDITADQLDRPTPCRDWNLHMLMLHLNESLTVLREGIDDGAIDLFPATRADPAVGLAAVFRYRAGGLLGSCASGDVRGRTGIADRSLPTALVASVGALEVAVHGWDVAQAQGNRAAIPSELARSLLDLAAVIVGSDSRGPLFAPPVPVRPPASPGDRLIAFLGRTP